MPQAFSNGVRAFVRKSWRRAMWLTQVGPTPWGTALSHAHYRCARGRSIVPYGPFSGTLGGECHAKKALPAWRLRCARTPAHRPHADERIGAAGGTPGPRSVGALPLSQAHSPLVAYDSFGLPARECSRPAPSRPRVRTASLSIAQFLLSYAFHHFVGERLGLLRGLGGGDEGQEVFDDVAHPGEAIAARRQARLRGGCVHHSAHQVIGDHGGMDLLGDHFRAGAGELLQF